MTSASTSSNQLLASSADGVVRLTLNRPDRRNALSEGLLADLESAIERIAADRAARVVVLAGNGPVFCSGHDLGEMTGRTPSEYERLFARCTRVMQRLRELPQPVIARVHGLATAAGCQLVAACDLAIASTEARFATPGVKIGLFCTTPMVPLVRKIPPGIALEMLLTGAPISARRALEVGLVNRVVPVDQLDDALDEFSAAIVSSSPATVRIGKQAFYDQLPLDENEAYSRATRVIARNAQHADAQEGITAFLEKRPPQWTGD